MRHGTLSFVVPIHGQYQATAKFLESYERQSVRAPLTFVDDESPDESVATLKARGYEVVVPSERLWFNGILRKAISECETEFLAFVNNDILLPWNFVERTLDCFRDPWDILVPLTNDMARPPAIIPLEQQEGWCMVFRVESVRKLPPIPDDLKIWYGDTWIFNHAWATDLSVGKMCHVAIAHEVSRTVRAVGGCNNPTIQSDILNASKYNLQSSRSSYQLARTTAIPTRMQSAP